jgi:ABC-type transport system involved in multi-copper enzyme maturation permease subunit
MMLFYKAWRDTRARFLWGALALSLFLVLIVLERPQMQTSLLGLGGRAYSNYIEGLVGSFGKFIFGLLVIFLGVGGLLRERAHRTATFTLALPVSRAQLLASHIAVGLAELSLLSLLPAIVIPPLSLAVHQSFAVEDALRFSILWFVCGTLIFALSFFLSVILKGEYTAPIVCYIVLSINARASNWHAEHPSRLNLLRTMGAPHDISLSAAQFPWTDLSLLLMLALLLFTAATRITQRQDL